MTLHKLKVAALQHEQREDWGSAIELYRQAIREAEGSADAGDPSLHNRIGDLAHKAGNDVDACEAWEQAVARYADLGFLNSAIGLCGKILRVDPRRVQTLLELARLHARKRVLYDVRRYLELYLKQQAASGHRDAAVAAVERLADEFPGWREFDSLLDELLGRQGSVPLRPTDAASGEPPRDLVFLDTGTLTIERASEPVAGLEATIPSVPDAAADVDTARVEGLVGAPPAAGDLAAVRPVEGLDHIVVTPPVAGTPSVEGFETTAAATEDAGGAAEDDGEPIGGPLVFIETDATTPATAPPESLPPPPASDDPLGERVTAHALLEHGDRAGGIAALERSLQQYQENEEWVHAYQVISELIQAEPRSIPRYEARVEVAARMRDRERLCDAYAELGDALRREGSSDKAVAVYRRILELDDGNARAREALRAMAPGAERDDTESGFIDLGAMLIDDHPRSTRMRTETPEIDADENETFRDALAEFKRALDQNLPVEDHQAHYDLGIAFKEMGLLDEAVTEFQKALRAPEVRLRTSEALGQVFFEQGRPAVAEAVLRGVENSAEGDAEKIGVLYWLGRALDAQDRHPEAISYYQRVVAVDVAFRDASDRLRAPPGEGTS